MAVQFAFNKISDYITNLTILKRKIISSTTTTQDLSADVAAINSISIIPQLLDVICRTTGMGFAAIARVTEDRWITCTAKDDISFGVKPGDELKVKTTICSEVRAGNKPVYIADVKEDEIYRSHPTPAMYGFRSYISVPIYRRDGSFFGTLCAIDPNPANILTEEIKGMFSLFAELISFHLEAVREKEVAEVKLEEELKNSELREQFIAILGHDLKNPIATTRMSADILLAMSKDEMVRRNASIIKSTSYRMESLIENVLDFARGKLGEGIILTKSNDKSKLEKNLQQVINEIKTISPERQIEIEFHLDKPVNCDPARIAQLFSNLLGNADTHGAEDTPIHVYSSCTNGNFILSVTNKGEKIPEDALKHLFQPFYREHVKPGNEGLGLGLYIASEIARAHEGEIIVDSSDKETSFTFQMKTE